VFDVAHLAKPIRAAFDARLKELCRLEPRVVVFLHRLAHASAVVEPLPLQATRSGHAMDAVVRYTPSRGAALVLHIEFQARADAAMPDRMFGYWHLLLRYAGTGDAIRQLVLRLWRTAAMPTELRFPAGDRSALHAQVRALDDYAAAAMLEVATAPVAPLPLLATLVPAAHGGATRAAIAASLEILHHSAIDRAWYIQLTALHRALAELNCERPGLWREVAMSIDPLLADAHEDDDAWFLADLEHAMARRAAYVEARGMEMGRRVGIEEERARAAIAARARLLRLASVAVDAETLVALEAIDDVDALEAAVMAALAR
jgi:hypothetical protein